MKVANIKSKQKLLIKEGNKLHQVYYSEKPNLTINSVLSQYQQ